MRAKKQSAPVVIACIFAATCTAALANNPGSPGSSLDPNNYVPSPTSKLLNKAPKSQAPAGEPQEETQSTTTFVTMPGFETPAEKNAAKAKPTAVDNGSGLLSGVNDKFKSAGSGVVSGTKAAGDHVVKGTKAVGGGIASGAKASGSFFMKGARAIGSGTKKMGSKVAVIPKAIGHGAKAAGDNIKDGTHAVADRLPFTGKSSAKDDELKSVASKQESVASKQEPIVSKQVPVVSKQDDVKPVANSNADALAKFAAIPESKKQLPSAVKAESTKEVTFGPKPGIVGKTFGTFGKLNVFHKKGAPAVNVETAGKTPTGADITH
jgi:hypothetical protein